MAHTAMDRPPISGQAFVMSNATLHRTIPTPAIMALTRLSPAKPVSVLSRPNAPMMVMPMPANMTMEMRSRRSRPSVPAMISVSA